MPTIRQIRQVQLPHIEERNPLKTITHKWRVIQVKQAIGNVSLLQHRNPSTYSNVYSKTDLGPLTGLSLVPFDFEKWSSRLKNDSRS